jgi:hypothetical protein
MNRLVFLCLSVLFIPELYCQSWYPDEAEWFFNREVLLSFPAHGYSHYTVEGDTIIESEDAKIIRRTDMSFNGSVTDESEIHYFKEENSRVHFWTGTEFELMYDLTLNPGDTLKRPIHINPTCDSVTAFVVDSVSQININDSFLKIQYLSSSYFIESESEPVLHKEVIIERIGRLEEFIFKPECSRDAVPWETLLLRCYRDNEIHYTADWWRNYMPGASCDSLIDGSTGIEADFQEEQLLIYPNPASNSLTIESPYSDIQEIYLYNSAGKLITIYKPGCNSFEINTSRLEDGFYFLNVSTSDFSRSRVVKVWKKF